jgi:glutamine amidotransferase-like uncharacterized protein
MLVLIALSFIVSDCEDSAPNKSADIAIYSENGVWNNSVIAAENMFHWLGKSVVRINANYVNNNLLTGFQILCVPGGDMYQYSQDISESGKEKIRAFVRNGGGYIGLCGGAYFASKTIIWQGNQLPMTPLGLFDGSAEGNIDAIVPYPQRNMCQVNISDTTHFITDSISSPLWILYYWGPIFTPNSSGVTVLGKYATVDKPAMIAFDYGQGRVFMVGTHPEIDEDSNRDGVILPDTVINGTHYLGEDQLNDRGSDWDLMKNAVEWCLMK